MFNWFKTDSKLTLEKFEKELVIKLNEDLYSCVLYGSMIINKAQSIPSNINVLFVLKKSTPECHAKIRELLKTYELVQPFIIDQDGMKRGAQFFATKFMSIKRSYKVLVGEDPFTNLTLSNNFDKFTCEQSIRNIRLRAIQAYVKNSDNYQSYSIYLQKVIVPVFVDISEVARIENTELPFVYHERISILQDFFSVDMAILKKLLEFKNSPFHLTKKSSYTLHSELLTLLTSVLSWISVHWQLVEPECSGVMSDE